MSFYNTTQATGAVLVRFEQKAGTQETAVLNIFRTSKKGLTASEVFKIFPAKNTPITSIRRAITNLMENKYLVKTSIRREGIYGRPETEYRLYTGQMTLFN